ncbi:MAG: amidase [Acidimicrobiales bacterium]
MTTWLERWPAGDGNGPTVAVKDLIDVEGSITTGGCRALADLAVPASADAPCIAAIRRSGGRLVGKVNLHELAFGTSGINPWFGTPPNPVDPGRVPGGSSSGSAVAVGLGEADIALGSDTGGSVRIPAACCGVVGLKTTKGLISTRGVWPLAPSYDTVGVLASDVARVVLGMEMLGVDMAPPVIPAVLGRAALLAAVPVDPVIDAAVDSALAAAGLATEPVRLETWADAHRHQQLVLAHEAYQSDRHLLELDGGRAVSSELRARFELGRNATVRELEQARAFGGRFAAFLGAGVGRYGVLALPTLALRPPRLEEFGPGFNILTAPVNLAGFPAISLPVPAGRSRPPCGLQLVGLPGSEALICAVAASIEAAVAT